MTNPKIVLDFETNGLRPYDGSRPFIVGMETEDGKVMLARPGDKVRIKDIQEYNWVKFETLVQSPLVDKICHNAKFEIKHTKHLGLTPKGKFHDTMALSVLINEYWPTNLGWLSGKHLKDFTKDIIQNWLKANKRSFKKEHGRNPNYSDVPKELLEKYLEGDLDKTLRLFWLFYPVIEKNPKLLKLYNMETDLAHDIANMEDRGVAVDIDRCYAAIKELKPRQKELADKIFNRCGFKFNLASPAQLGDIFEQLDIDTGERTATGKPKTSYDLLSRLMDKHPFINDFITWRTINKILATYIVPFTQISKAGQLHPEFWQYGKDRAIVTGRLSSWFHTLPSRAKNDNPELIKIGNLVKQCIIPRPGKAFVFFDFKQIEMRIFAHYTKEKELINKIKAGVDPYLATAHILFGKKFMDNLKGEKFDTWRDRAKQVSLAFIYGMGIDLLAHNLKYTRQEASDIKRKFFNALPHARELSMSMQRDILSKGYCEDIFGRRYHVPTDMCYKGVNAICQGSAATIMKQTILKSRQLQQYTAYPFLTLHDEIGLECDIDMVDTVCREGKKLLEDNTTFSVPLNVDVEVSYTNWKEKTKWTQKK